jgi:hypothetical protein
MKRESRIRLGNPATSSGAVYVVQNQADLLQMALELEYLRLFEDGIPITPQLDSLIQDRVRRELMILKHKLSSQGIPKELNQLFDLTSKSELNKYCRTLQFNEFDFFLLIHNCNQIGLSHFSKFPEFVPDHLIITDSDRGKLKDGNTRSFSKKATSLMKFRKRYHIHLFERNTEWHCFFFTYNDIDTNKKSHWKHGTHLHFVNHLWPHYSRNEVLKLFDARKSKITDYLHIRFFPFEYSQTYSPSENVIFSEFGWQPMLLAIDSNLQSNPNSNPSPIAQITTRGFWSAEVSTRN